MKPKPRRPGLYVFICLLCVIGLVLLRRFAPNVPKENTPLLCTQVIDGNTIRVKWRGRIERVRLLGVDTAERDPSNRKDLAKYGRAIIDAGAYNRATEFLRGLCEGKKVRLRYSRSSPRLDGTSSKRILAYVFVDNGGKPIDVNAEICRQGFTYWYSKYEHDRREEFKQYVEEARDAKRGLWSLEKR
jgi:endonuclease YncB( thermonuclease family)